MKAIANTCMLAGTLLILIPIAMIFTLVNATDKMFLTILFLGVPLLAVGMFFHHYSQQTYSRHSAYKRKSGMRSCIYLVLICIVALICIQRSLPGPLF
jgi:hypothetical protein